MKAKFIFLFLSLWCGAVVLGQNAKDFTLTAVDFETGTASGEEVHLYDLLDEGKPVVIDFYTHSCQWCSIYSPIIEKLYEDHGPDGDNSLNVVGVCMGSAGASLENMVSFWSNTPVGFPSNLNVFDENNIAGSNDVYDIHSYPTYLVICPDRSWHRVSDYEVEVVNYQYTGGPESLSDSIIAIASRCSGLAANSDDARLYEMIRESSLVCGDKLNNTIKFQNRGTEPLTSLDIVTVVNDEEYITHWTGNLPTYDYQEIDLDEITLADGDYSLEFRVEKPNGNEDANNEDNVLSGFDVTMISNGVTVTVENKFEYGANDFSWDFKLDDNLIMQKTFTAEQSYGMVSSSVCLMPGKCYDFTLHCESGYGINADVTNEYCKVMYNGVEAILFNKVNFLGDPANGNPVYEITEELCTDPDGVAEMNQAGRLVVYPNPAKDKLNLEVSGLNSGEEVDFTLINAMGQIVLSKCSNASVWTFDIHKFPAGMYYVIAKTESLSIIQKVVVN